MRWMAMGLAAALLAGAPAMAEPLTASAESTVEIGHDEDLLTVRTVNRSFEWLGLYDRERNGYRHLLLRKTEDVTLSSGADGALASQVRLEVSEIDGDEFDPLFVIEDAAETGQLDSFAWSNAYFTTVRYGCCGALDARHTYSLLNGRLLFTATAAPAWFEVPNGGGLVRIAAIHTIFSIEDEQVFGEHKNALGLVTYASPQEPLQRFLISMNGQLADERLEYPDPRLGWAEGDNAPAQVYEVWSADGATDLALVKNLVLTVSVGEGLDIRVPLVEGRLALDQASLPTGLEISAAELP